MIRTALVPLLLVCGCSTGAAMHELTLPMPVPRDAATEPMKGEPLRVGASAPVPAELQVVDPAALEWRDGVARLVVTWPGARGLQLRVQADGDWAKQTRVRVVDAAGAPLHRDWWHPARLNEWTSPPAIGDEVTLEIEHAPGAGARLIVTSATTRTTR